MTVNGKPVSSTCVKSKKSGTTVTITGLASVVKNAFAQSVTITCNDAGPGKSYVRSIFGY